MANKKKSIEATDPQSKPSIPSPSTVSKVVQKPKVYILRIGHTIDATLQSPWYSLVFDERFAALKTILKNDDRLFLEVLNDRNGAPTGRVRIAKVVRMEGDQIFLEQTWAQKLEGTQEILQKLSMVPETNVSLPFLK